MIVILRIGNLVNKKKKRPMFFIWGVFILFGLKCSLSLNRLGSVRSYGNHLDRYFELFFNKINIAF